MEIINTIAGFFEILNSPVETILTIIICLATLPFTAMALDKITQMISDFMIQINTKIIDKIPLKPLKDWLQNSQVKMIENSIKSYKDTIVKIKKT